MRYNLKFQGLLIRDAEWEREWDCPKESRLAEDLEMIEVCLKLPNEVVFLVCLFVCLTLLLKLPPIYVPSYRFFPGLISCLFHLKFTLEFPTIYIPSYRFSPCLIS